MNLISLNTSWDQINSIFNKYYSNSTINYYNLKDFLFHNQNTLNIVYIDTLKKDGKKANLGIFKLAGAKTYVFNDTVTIVPYDSIFLISNQQQQITFVFKHQLNTLSNLSFPDSGGVHYLFSNNNRKVVVPVGLRTNYITLFSQMQGWQESYADKIYEGDEFTEFEEE